MKTYYRWRWWTVVLRGVAAVLFGLACLFAPQAAFLSLVVLFGAFAIVNGALALGLASHTTRGARGPMIAHAIISIVAGVLALVWPGITALVLLFVIAAWAIISGILEVVTAVRLRHELEHEWLLGIEGGLSIVFGVLLVLAPLAGAVVMALWVGAYLLVIGGLLIGNGFRMRHITAEPPTAAAAA